MKRNAFFQLVQKQDGVYLKSYPALEGGAPLSVDDILYYLEQKKIMDVSVDDITSFVQKASETVNAEKRIMIGKILPENEFPVVTIDPERKFAKIRLYPPSSAGKRLSLKELLERIGQNGVQYGILKENAALLLKAHLYCTDVLIAKAKPPVQGRDAKITYHFDVDKTCRPAMDESGNVDFHHLDMIEHVREGQHLATLAPADTGISGIDVMGEEFKPKKVVQRILKHGRNIHLSEDGLEMYSDVSGNVTMVDETVFVSNQYEVPADVGASTGDIDYDGSVVVKGNVLTGYAIKATGDIIVNGVVEGAKLATAGKIVLKRGIPGKGQASLEAGGDVISNFIESASVECGGRVITDAIMHSHVTAEDDIIARGKRGMITGGALKTKTRIEAKTIGSTMGTTTVLEVGIDPKLVERYHLLEKDAEQLALERESLVQNVLLLKKRLDTQGKLDEEKLASMKRAGLRIKEIDAALKDNEAERAGLSEEIRKKDSGRIVAENIVYPGVKMTISSVSTNINSEVQHSAFVRDGADIRIRAI